MQKIDLKKLYIKKLSLRADKDGKRELPPEEITNKHRTMSTPKA